MSASAGRAIAWVSAAQLSLQELRALGWEVDDLGEPVLLAIRDFASLAEARSVARRDLPAGSVDWVSHDGDVFGGFVVGMEIAPELGGLVPAWIVWPDGSESRVGSREELAGALRGRMPWLVELGRASGFFEFELEAGCRVASAA